MELIDNSGVSQDSVIELSQKVEDKYWHVLLLPQNAKRKDRIGEIGRLFAEMAGCETLKIPEFKSKVTDTNIHVDNAHALRAIGMFLGYFLNCTSWNNATKEEYDSIELKKRIDRIKQFL